MWLLQVEWRDTSERQVRTELREVTVYRRHLPGVAPDLQGAKQ